MLERLAELRPTRQMTTAESLGVADAMLTVAAGIASKAFNLDVKDIEPLFLVARGAMCGYANDVLAERAERN